VREETLTRDWLSWAAALVLLVGCGEANDGPPRPDRDATSDAGADAEDEEVDAGPGTPVTGSWVNTRINLQGKTPSPVDLSRYEIGVWTQSSSPRYLPGSGSMDGSFAVPDVPPGPFLLILKRTGFPDSVASDGNVRTFDLGVEFFQASTTSAPAAAPKSIIALTLSNLTPWNPSDFIKLIHNLDYARSFQGSFFLTGATMGTLSVDYGNVPGVDGPGRGDEVLIVQQGRTVLPSGLSVWTTRNAVTTRALHTADGQTVMATENLQVLPPDGVVAFDVRRSQYLPFAPVSPDVAGAPSIRIEMSRVPPAANGLGGFTTSIVDTPNGDSDMQIDARESNPFPPTWARFASATVSFPIAMFVPGGMRPLVDAATMRVYDSADVLQAAPVTPRLSPPRAPQIAGQSAELARTGVGLTPRLSWTAPSFGQPTLYQVLLSRIEVSVDETSTSPQLMISTDQTSVTLPPGLLQRGSWYRFRVSALLADGNSVSTPKRIGLPRVDASMFSGRFTP
jgi:hypothetical protein